METQILHDGVSWVADLSTVPASAFASPPAAGSSNEAVTEWLSGNLAREWVVRVPFVHQSNPGRTHDHLVARYNIRHYASGNTKVDVIVENNWAFSPNHRSYSYQVEVLLNGERRYRDNALNHFAHARWKVTLWSQSYPELHIVHDPIQLISSRVSPNYLPGLIGNLRADLESEYDSLWNEHRPSEINGLLEYNSKTIYCHDRDKPGSSSTVDCNTPNTLDIVVNNIGPMGKGVLPIRNQRNTGGRAEIAPLPKWTALYILGQRYSYYKMMMAIADGSGSWPVHVRDDATDLPLSIQNHPGAVINSQTSRSQEIEVCDRDEDCMKPYVANAAHEPSFVFIPYVVTGDYYYLEELQFWATYNAAILSPGSRGGDRGLLEAGTQVRQRGWSLRTLSNVSYITPDNSTLKAHYLYMLKSNIDEFTDIYVSDPSRSNTYGVTVPSRTGRTTAPWMQDYQGWAFGNIVQLGYKSALPIARWTGKFPTQRMGFDGSNFCWIFGGTYRLRIAPNYEEFPTAPDAETVTILHSKGTDPTPVVLFKNIDDLFTHSNTATNGGYPLDSGKFSTVEACGSAAQAAEIGEPVGVMKYEGATGLVSQMGPALSAAVDLGVNESSLAWNRYSNRAGKPDYSSEPQWAIVPLSELDRTIDFFSMTLAGYPHPGPSGGECIP